MSRSIVAITEERAAVARQLAILSVELEEAITARRAAVLDDIDERKLSRHEIAAKHDVSLSYIGNLVFHTGRSVKHPPVPMRMWTDQQRLDFRKLTSNGYPRDRARAEILGGDAQ